MKTVLKAAAAALIVPFFAGGAASLSAAEKSASIAVPEGHKPVMTLKGVGQLTYECRAKAGAIGVHEWVFVGPDATLQDATGRTVGKYYAGPTWQHNDGGTITGKQLAVAPGPAGAIPLQLVQTSPAVGAGPFEGVTYIQRVNTTGGVAPGTPCLAGNVGSKQTVSYSADYVFYKP
jgi:hypothetical protein